MNTRLILFALIIFFSSPVFAQSPDDVGRFFYELSKKDPFEQSDIPDVIDRNEIYLNPEFQKGTVSFAGRSFDLMYRVNILDNQIEVKQNQDSDINYLNMVSGIKLTDSKNSESYSFLPVDGMQVVSVLHQSDQVRLAKTYEANLIIPTREINGYTASNQPRFNRLKDKYVIIYGTKVIEVNKWKRMTDEFSNPQIINYLKKVKPKFKTEAEMMAFATFLDTI